MKRMTGKIAVLALALLMLLGSVQIANAATPPNPEESLANINFEAGEINIDPDPEPGETGYESMNISFGKRRLPIRQEIYVADGGCETVFGSTTPTDGVYIGTDPTNDLTPATVGIRVDDPRASVPGLGAWRMKAAFTTSFEAAGANPVFNARLTLRDGQIYTNALDDTKLAVNNAVVDGDGKSLLVFDTKLRDVVLVLSAENELGKGIHGAYWNNTDILLQPYDATTDGDGYDVIEEDTYTAKMTWTLEIDI